MRTRCIGCQTCAPPVLAWFHSNAMELSSTHYITGHCVSCTIASVLMVLSFAFCVCVYVCVCVSLSPRISTWKGCVCRYPCFCRSCQSKSLYLSAFVSLYIERERKRERERLCPVVIQFHACAGIFKHSQSFSKTYLADLVPEQERSSVLGHFNASSNIGFILGPVVGGHLAELPGGFQYVACISGGVFWINAGEVYCCCWSLLYSVVLQSRGDCALVARDSRWVAVAFYSTFWISTQVVCLQCRLIVAWLVPRETAAILAHSVHTLEPCHITSCNTTYTGCMRVWP